MNVQTSAAPALKPVVDEIQLIPVDKIKPSPFNARKDFPKEYLAELGASLARDGQQTPVKVRPKDGGFELVFGECRWRAGKLAGLEKLKAIVEPMDDARAEHLCLIENLKRRDLSVFEEAEKLKRLHEVHKVKVEDLAVQVGLAVRTIRENIKLATVAPEVQKLVVEEKLKLSLAKLISRLPSAITQAVVADKAVAEQMTHEDLEKHIREHHMQDLRFAPFDIKAKGLECLAASCVDCPRNARNLKEEMPDLKGADVCTAPQSYREKVIRFGKAEAARQGGQFMDGSHLFNRWGELDGTPGRRSALYVRADAQHPKDPKERPWRDLISAEDFKKHLVIVLTPKAELMELLDNEKGGVDAAVKSDGKLTKAVDREKTKTTQVTEVEKESDKERQARTLRERVLPTALPMIFEKLTKQPKLGALQLAVKRLLKDSDVDYEEGAPYDLAQRRSWKSPQEAEKTIDKMDGQEIGALIVDVTLGWQLGQTVGGYSDELLELAKIAAVDLKKLEKKVGTQIQWSNPGSKKVEIPGVLINDDKGKPTKRYTDPERTTLLGIGPHASYTVDVYGPNNVRLGIWEKNGGFCPPAYPTVFVAQEAAAAHNKDPGQPKWKLDPRKPAPKKAAKKGGGR